MSQHDAPTRHARGQAWFEAACIMGHRQSHYAATPATAVLVACACLALCSAGGAWLGALLLDTSGNATPPPPPPPWPSPPPWRLAVQPCAHRGVSPRDADTGDGLLVVLRGEAFRQGHRGPRATWRATAEPKRQLIALDSIRDRVVRAARQQGWRAWHVVGSVL